MIQIYKNYEGKKELEELDHIELESWVMVTDPTMEELTSISVDYKIDMDDLKAALDTEERSRLENEDDSCEYSCCGRRKWEKMVRDDSIGNFYYQEDRIYGMSKADKYFKAVCRWSCIEFLYLYEDKICLSDTV